MQDLDAPHCPLLQGADIVRIAAIGAVLTRAQQALLRARMGTITNRWNVLLSHSRCNSVSISLSLMLHLDVVQRYADAGSWQWTWHCVWEG